MHIMIVFSVAAALINKYHLKIQDREDAGQILEIVNQNMNINNDLSDYVRDHNLNRARADFQIIKVTNENIIEFPRLNINELILIACCSLLRARIASQHISRKVYFVYI